MHNKLHRTPISILIFFNSLSAVLSAEQRDRLSITHIVSVCPDYPSTGPRHLTIPVQDSELDNLLIHLPEACRFIQNALEQGGRILLHCVMGISRSITVLAAYRKSFLFPFLFCIFDRWSCIYLFFLLFKVMKTRNLSPSEAIRFIKQRMSYKLFFFFQLIAAYLTVISITTTTTWQGDRRLNQTMVLSSNSMFLKNVAMNLHYHIRSIDPGNVVMHKMSTTTSTI